MEPLFYFTPASALDTIDRLFDSIDHSKPFAVDEYRAGLIRLSRELRDACDEAELPFGHPARIAAGHFFSAGDNRRSVIDRYDDHRGTWLLVHLSDGLRDWSRWPSNAYAIDDPSGHRWTFPTWEAARRSARWPKPLSAWPMIPTTVPLDVARPDEKVRG